MEEIEDEEREAKGKQPKQRKCRRGTASCGDTRKDGRNKGNDKVNGKVSSRKFRKFRMFRAGGRAGARIGLAAAAPFAHQILDFVKKLKDDAEVREHAPALAILSHAVSAFDEAATSFQRAISGPPVPGVANSGAQLAGICGAKDFFRTLFLGKVTEKQHMNSAEEACWRRNHPGQASWPGELETAKAEAENAKAEKENRDGINKVLNGCATFGVAALDKITDSGIEKPCNEIFDEFQKQELLEVPGQTGNDQLLTGCWNGASDTDEKRCLEIYHDSGTCEELYKIGNCSADGQNCCKEIYEKIIKDFTSPGHNSTVFEFDAQGACKNAGEECNCTCDFERFVSTVEGPKVEG